MSRIKFRRPVLFDAGYSNSTLAAASTGSYNLVPIQTLTGASTATEVTNVGVTVIASTGSGAAGAKVFRLAAPLAGQRKTIIGRVASTKAVSVRTASSLGTFYGTTANSFTFTTGSTYAFRGVPVELLGLSTLQWAVLNAGSVLAQSTAVSNFRLTVAGATA